MENMDYFFDFSWHSNKWETKAMMYNHKTIWSDKGRQPGERQGNCYTTNLVKLHTWNNMSAKQGYGYHNQW